MKDAPTGAEDFLDCPGMGGARKHLDPPQNYRTQEEKGGSQQRETQEIQAILESYAPQPLQIL